MAIYAYCLLRKSATEMWPVMRGVGQHPVFPFHCEKYAMLLSRLERDFAFTPRSIVEHAQVIARAFETHTVLPMRFGTFFHSERQIEQVIRKNRGDLLEAFCRLRGKAEMRLKLISPPLLQESKTLKKLPQKFGGSANDSTHGFEVPLDAEAREFAQQMAALMRESFWPLEEQVACRQLRTGEVVVDCAHLIESQKVGAYQELSRVASGQIEECTLRLSGPWPPYHFLPASVRLPAPAARPVSQRAAFASR